MKGADHLAEVVDRCKASKCAGQLEKFQVCQAGAHNVETNAETRRSSDVLLKWGADAID